MLVPFSPPPGINKDDSAFAAEGQWADSNGFRFVQGRPETIGGAAEMSSATAVVRANKMLVYDASGTIKLAVAGDTLRIAAPNTAGNDITPAANWTPNRRHCLAMYGDVLLALVSGGRLFESSGGAQAMPVANAPTQSTAMLVTPSRQVMLLGTQEEESGTFNARCIRWSDIEDRTSWTTSSTNNAGEYILPGQEEIVAACLLGDYILIWTEGALWLAQFVGDPGQTFAFQRVADIGIVGLDAFAIYRQAVYWIGPDLSFYAYQVGGIAQNIPCPVGRYFREGLSPAALPTTFGCTNSRYGEVWVGAPWGSDNPAYYFVFCVEESVRAQRPVWFIGLFTSGLGTSAAGAMVESSLQWDDGTYSTKLIAHAHETGGGKPYRWDCATTALGISASSITSADFYLDNSQRRSMVRGIIPDFDAQGGTVHLTLRVRDRPMSASTLKGPHSLTTATTKKDFRASGKIMSVTFETTSAIRVRLGKPLFDVVPLGER